MYEIMNLKDLFTVEHLLIQMEFLLRIVTACGLGMVIGNERKNRNKAAGIRTHAIVCMGAALIMVVSKYGFTDIPNYDAARVAAQVVSGIGFLGAGVIFVRNNAVNGLTTAAGLWATAAVGLAMGSGMYVIGILITLIMVILQYILHKIAFFANEASMGCIKLTVTQKKGVIQEMEAVLERDHIERTSIKIIKNKKDEIKLEFEVIYPPGYNRTGLLTQLAEMDNVLVISE